MSTFSYIHTFPFWCPKIDIFPMKLLSTVYVHQCYYLDSFYTDEDRQTDRQKDRQTKCSCSYVCIFLSLSWMALPSKTVCCSSFFIAQGLSHCCYIHWLPTTSSSIDFLLYLQYRQTDRQTDRRTGPTSSSSTHILLTVSTIKTGFRLIWPQITSTCSWTHRF